MSKKTAYRLVADIGDLKRGATVELTAEKAASPLYASRIVPVADESAAPGVDLDALRADVRKELQAEAGKLIADAQAEAKKIVETAQAEAMKLAAGGGKK